MIAATQTAPYFQHSPCLGTFIRDICLFTTAFLNTDYNNLSEFLVKKSDHNYPTEWGTVTNA